MFGDFCYPNFYPPFPQHLQMQQAFPFFSYLKRPFIPQNLIKTSQQSYTTKQITVKQEVILVKRQQFQPVLLKREEENGEMTKKRQNKSIFHNYQKHLVTTLKQKISIEELKQQHSEDQCSKELWKSFTKAKIANRSLLLAVFGQEKFKDEEVANYLKKCQFSEVVNKFTIPEVREAQGKIRRIVQEYFKGKNLDQELTGRKLPASQKKVFKHYVSYFLSELREGTLNRRMPKRYKRQMMI